MSRYIDADALKENCYKKMDELMESTSEHLSTEALSLLCGFTLIDSAPSIDIEPKQGEWIEVDDYFIRCKCSICGWESHKYEDDVYGMPYCPNCGARMKETDNE